MVVYLYDVHPTNYNLCLFLQAIELSCTAVQLLKTLDKTYQRGDDLRSESLNLLRKIQGEPTRSSWAFHSQLLFLNVFFQLAGRSPVALLLLDPRRVLGRVEAIKPYGWEHRGGHQDVKRSPMDVGEDAKTELQGSERAGKPGAQKSTNTWVNRLLITPVRTGVSTPAPGGPTFLQSLAPTCLDFFGNKEDLN